MFGFFKKSKNNCPHCSKFTLDPDKVEQDRFEKKGYVIYSCRECLQIIREDKI